MLMSGVCPVQQCSRPVLREMRCSYAAERAWGLPQRCQYSCGTRVGCRGDELL